MREQSGNPAGRRKGTPNRATLLAPVLAADESGAIARVVLDTALAGDGVAARFRLRLLVPRRRGRPIELDLPECSRPEDLIVAFDVTFAAMAAGQITPDEALAVSRVLDRRCRAPASTRDADRIAEVTAAAATLAPAAPDLHSACNSPPIGAPAEIAAATDAAPAPPLAPARRDLHSACNSPPIAAPAEIAAATDAAPAPTLAPARRDLHPACNSRPSGTIRGAIAWRPRSGGGGSGLDRRRGPIISSALG